MPKGLLALILLLAAVFWTACGGGSSNNSGGGSTGGGGTGGGAVNPPVVVSVSAGQAASGINIVVPAPASSPTPNATLVGADGKQAFSSGDVLHRNSTANVIIAGTGLNTSMIASLSGPADIMIGPLQSVNFKGGGTGVSFPATMAPNAALGARTLILQDAKNDITTFAGGLEVVP
jgi:hypothetical protein